MKTFIRSSTLARKLTSTQNKRVPPPAWPKRKRRQRRRTTPDSEGDFLVAEHEAEHAVAEMVKARSTAITTRRTVSAMKRPCRVMGTAASRWTPATGGDVPPSRDSDAALAGIRSDHTQLAGTKTMATPSNRISSSPVKGIWPEVLPRILPGTSKRLRPRRNVGKYRGQGHRDHRTGSGGISRG